MTTTPELGLPTCPRCGATWSAVIGLPVVITVDASTGALRFEVDLAEADDLEDVTCECPDIETFPAGARLLIAAEREAGLDALSELVRARAGALGYSATTEVPNP